MEIREFLVCNEDNLYFGREGSLVAITDSTITLRVRIPEGENETVVFSHSEVEEI
ncbi:hypothetical protein [Neobacillus niacini]|uniref:hypothetical protein n=1 Tax=Neobacillus niacini TaxID=86668 RepID=UPI0021CB004D|nr:hypothetical protein [Neobacillus niacini]MCM3763464.1 hypothetical protein [Neobacillus niacini]